MQIEYLISPPIEDYKLNSLYASAWPNHRTQSFEKELAHTLFYVCAISGEDLVGFVKVIGDGAIHGFVLEPTVHPKYQRQSIGSELLAIVKKEGKRLGLKWLHVDFEPHLLEFYRKNGFFHTEAGLVNLDLIE